MVMVKSYIRRYYILYDNISKEFFMRKFKYILQDHYFIIIPLCMISVLFIFGAFTGIWPLSGNSFNSYSLQAEAWLNGNLALDRNYEHLELAIYNGQYYVSFPPFPSYVLLPFVYFLGVNTPDNLISDIATVIGALYAYKLALKILGNDRKNTAFILTMLIYIGSNTLFFINNGWVWFIAQNFSFTLTILALYYAACAKPGLSLFFWACAVGCRPLQILYLPVLIILMVNVWRKQDNKFTITGIIKKQWYKGIPCFMVALSYFILNYARFGSIFEFGHNYLPEFTRTETGQFNIAYLAQNLKQMFRLPVFNDTKRLNFYNCDGIALWLVNPVFILFLIILIYKTYTVIRKKAAKHIYDNTELSTPFLILSLALVHIIILCMHKTLGGWHFGNRYTCDIIPAIFTGTMLCMPNNDKFKPVTQFILIFGFALNLVGTIAVYNYWI